MKMVRFLVDAIFQRDYPVVHARHLLLAWCMLLRDLLVAVIYGSVHRDIRYPSVVGLIARALLQGKVSYEHSAFPQAPRDEPS
jgi:hypothetical protein